MKFEGNELSPNQIESVKIVKWFSTQSLQTQDALLTILMKCQLDEHYQAEMLLAIDALNV